MGDRRMSLQVPPVANLSFAHLPGANLPFADRAVALVAAHPDDEILGAGAQICAMRSVSLIHLTDGVPSPRVARAHGFAGPDSYRAQRREELEAALRLAHPDYAGSVRLFSLGLPDGRSSFLLSRAAIDLAELLRRLAPDIILTHAYEGGHPDHDAAAWIARAAQRRLPNPPPLWEMTGYHGADGKMACNTFIPRPGHPAISVELDAATQIRKDAMLACFTSQAPVLLPFPRNREWFRPAPDYNFAQPPHPGRLLYENRIRAMRGRQWRWLAARAELAGRSPPGVLQRVVRRMTIAAWSRWLTG